MSMISEYLTPEEQFDAMRHGAETALARLSPGGIEKSAQLGGAAASAADKLFDIGTYLKWAILLGVPVGTLSYAFGSMLKPNVKKNRKLKHGLDQFNDVVEEYRRGMEGGDGA